MKYFIVFPIVLNTTNFLKEKFYIIKEILNVNIKINIQKVFCFRSTKTLKNLKVEGQRDLLRVFYCKISPDENKVNLQTNSLPHQPSATLLTHFGFFLSDTIFQLVQLYNFNPLIRIIKSTDSISIDKGWFCLTYRIEVNIRIWIRKIMDLKMFGLLLIFKAVYTNVQAINFLYLNTSFNSNIKRFIEAIFIPYRLYNTFHETVILS